MTILSPNFHSPYVFPAGDNDFDSCFLAPRGIQVTEKNLFVSDTAQNQIFYWNLDRNGDLVEENPSIIKTASITNKDAKFTFHYPSGLWSDGEKLIIADAWSHRVLVWHELPKNNAQLPDLVIGQPNLETCEINTTGEINKPKSDSLYWPYGVYYHKGQLWIADTGNRRILVYDKLPTENGSKADAVIGQQDFFSRDYSKDYFVWPYSVKINEKGEMLVADTSCFRVVYWGDYQDAFKQSFDLVLGQKNDEGSLQNNGLLKASASGLNWCYDALFFKDGLLVADTGNSRIMQWNQIPKENGTAANHLLGQTSFEASAENSSIFHRKKNNFYWPFSLSLNKSHLWIADTGNNRVVRYNIAPSSSVNKDSNK